MKSRKRLARVMIIALLIAAVFVIVSSSQNSARADESDQAHKRYTSININPGDTLWGIAGTYADGHYSTIQEYIDEVMFINHLDSDLINADEYLLVPYYVG